jgi:hypothetical protein
MDPVDNFDDYDPQVDYDQQDDYDQYAADMQTYAELGYTILDGNNDPQVDYDQQDADQYAADMQTYAELGYTILDGNNGPQVDYDQQDADQYAADMQTFAALGYIILDSDNPHVEVAGNNISNDVEHAVTEWIREQGYPELPTKEDFCRETVRDHIRAQRGEEDGMGYAYDAGDLIMSSSNYAIACEELGLILDPDMIEYTRGRGGSLIYLDERKFVCFRDVLHVLRTIVG